MSRRVSLRCRCGTVRGEVRGVSPQSGNRMVCYCDDCQAYAHQLERADILDAHGGTEIVQFAPGDVSLTAGLDSVRCLRLSEKGLYRYYAGCCRTPLANALSPRVPFVGVLYCVLDQADDGSSKDDLLGPPVAYAYGRFAVGGVPRHAHPSAPIGLIARIARLMATWWLTGRAWPSPLFDPATKRPIVPPQILTPGEREALRARASA